MKTTPFLTFLACAALQPLGAATAPYSNDFSGTGANTAFTTEAADAAWTVTGGAYQFNYSSTTVAPSTASITVTNMAGVAFTMQTQFTVTSAGNVNANGASIGFGLFGSSSTFSNTGGDSYYLADFQYGNSGTPGNLRVIALGNTAGATDTQVTVDANPGTPSLAVVVNTIYTLKLEGTYVGSTLNMTLGLYDAAGTAQIGTSATLSDTSVLTGTNFGFRNRIGLGGGTATVNFDNFNITTAAIPEPGMMALLLGAITAAGVVTGRRHRR